MPHAALKLIPGVDQNRTLALNEAALSTSNLIRFVPDRQGIGLPQKLGGWTKFYSGSVGSVIRALWAWEDINGRSWLGVGSEESLDVILNGALQNITPQTTTVNIAVSFSTTLGSAIVTIDATGSNLDAYDVVDIRTQVSIGGLILFGKYQVIPVTANQFQIQAVDVLGNPEYATSTVAAPGGAVPLFNVTSGSASIQVTLNNHGLQAGDTFPVLVSTTVGGIAISGNYTVLSSPVPTTNTFYITGQNTASSTTSGSENSGNVQMIYYNGVGPVAANSGYGVGGYGTGGYGSGVVSPSGAGTPITATDWALDNWGEIFVSCPLNGPIYTWSPSDNSPIAAVIANAPVANSGMVVAMPQRQIVAWGSTFNGIQDFLLIRWCDVDDYTTWAAQVTNQAGSFRIPKGSKIVQCIQGPQQTLVWTDLGLWAMQYVGPPYVYQFNEIGTGCGLIGRKAAASMGGVIYWMSQSQFFKLSGSGVEPVRCPVWDVIFQDLDTSNLDKIRIAPNSNFGEIAWYYPTKSNGGEVSHYVKYNVLLDQWDFGALGRTAWINQSVLGPPIGAGTNYYIYQHETSTDADGQAMDSYFQTGYFAMTEADVKIFVDQIWPDMKWGYYGGSQNAQVQITFYVTDYAGQTPITYGPYTMTQATTYITPRFRGRLTSIKIESNDIGSWWRIGAIRYRLQIDGKF
jgi:hypothetical protein